MAEKRMAISPLVRPRKRFSGDRSAVAEHLLDAADPNHVAAGLLGYLRALHPGLGLGFLEYPAHVPNGWETHTYRFQLQSDHGVPDAWAGPLVVRIYASPQGAPRARHEFAVQQFLHARSFRVPRPILLEETWNLFGGPFLILERLPGRTLFDTMLRQPYRVWGLPTRMAALHARLHLLPAKGFPVPEKPFLDRRLAELRSRLRQFELYGLAPGLDWLERHRPAPPRIPRILHLDYHPFNILWNFDAPPGVIDWTEADVGDPHADIATTLMLLACVPQPHQSLWASLSVPVGRLLMRRWYLSGYRRRLPLDENKLAYYRALAAFHRLAGYGRWLCAGPTSTGCKSSALRYLSPGHLARVEHYFRRWTGVTVHI
jgi:aminoglycoside phosphotransferase (APT) family kinase protein